ncbi:hypothetical protein O181_011805 [Austropuccinia psidii MF-1]|uniref:Tf2-1-like SH3-like domain-containing protein n=1 Tax=Austropuccinia psidii MF-1 TaxID=1389203 RepID=A0A9Q3GM99_9BASI|nr:hypothetical protein [Austropuccinia psidii MF-1]
MNIKTTRPTKKLSERWLGPFEVLKRMGSHAYHLKFPFQWNSVHPAFHVSLLEPIKQSSIPNQNQFPPSPALVEDQEEWEVTQVLDSKLKRGKLWYLLECKGFIEYCHNAVCQTSAKGTLAKRAIKTVERPINTGKF